jgi:hypothetical protein
MRWLAESRASPGKHEGVAGDLDQYNILKLFNFS